MMLPWCGVVRLRSLGLIGELSYDWAHTLHLSAVILRLTALKDRASMGMPTIEYYRQAIII